MYGWIWRTLPGPWPMRALLALLLLAVVVVVLFARVFPTVAPLLPFNDSTVGGA